MTMFFSFEKAGFFDSQIHNPSEIPEDAVEITIEEHQTLLDAQSTGKIITADADGHPTAVDPALPSLADRKARAKRMIDRAAGDARARFVSSGQLIEEEYKQAYQATIIWRSEGSPTTAVPEDIQLWSEVSGLTVEEAAVDIETTAALWQQILTDIRGIRLAGKAAVDAATDEEKTDDMENVAQTFIDQLAALTP